jgi:hypothetical protein
MDSFEAKKTKSKISCLGTFKKGSMKIGEMCWPIEKDEIHSQP